MYYDDKREVVASIESTNTKSNYVSVIDVDTGEKYSINMSGKEVREIEKGLNYRFLYYFKSKILIEKQLIE